MKISRLNLAAALLAGLLGFLLAMCPEALTARAQNMGSALPPDYQVLNRKSIFSRERTRRPAFGSATASAPATAATRASTVPVLIGTLIEEGVPVAVFETPDSGKLTELHIGDPLPASGLSSTAAPTPVIRDITLDYIDVFATDQAPRRILIGQDLQGAAASLPAIGSGSSSTTTGTTSGPSSGGSDLLEIMRRRRQQELNR